MFFFFVVSSSGINGVSILVDCIGFATSTSFDNLVRRSFFDEARVFEVRSSVLGRGALFMKLFRVSLVVGIVIRFEGF